MFLSRSEGAECCGASGIPSGFDIDFFSKRTKVFRFMVYDRKKSTQEEEVPRPDGLDIAAERCWRRWERDAKILQPPFRVAGLRSPRAYHRPACAPPSTCSTSPVMWRASVRKMTASAMSFASEIVPIGESVFRKSGGSSL